MYKEMCCTCKVVFFLEIRKKSVLHVQSCFFLLIKSIVVVFSVPLVFTLSLVLLDFIFSLRNL